eukprot:SAG31_NODE_2566_length_5466_cov_6.677846_7_plen_114_part_00
MVKMESVLGWELSEGSAPPASSASPVVTSSGSSSGSSAAGAATIAHRRTATINTLFAPGLSPLSAAASAPAGYAYCVCTYRGHAAMYAHRAGGGAPRAGGVLNLVRKYVYVAD